MDGAGLSKGESRPSGQPPSSAQGGTSAPGGGRRCWLLSSPISLGTFFLHSSLVSEVELWWGSFRLGNKRQVAQVACSLGQVFQHKFLQGESECTSCPAAPWPMDGATAGFTRRSHPMNLYWGSWAFKLRHAGTWFLCPCQPQSVDRLQAVKTNAEVEP